MKHLTSRFKPGLSLFACAVCALGLLLWARLLLVSHPPRIATAEPVAPRPQSQERQLPAPADKPPVDKHPDDKTGVRSDAGAHSIGRGE